MKEQTKDWTSTKMCQYLKKNNNKTLILDLKPQHTRPDFLPTPCVWVCVVVCVVARSRLADFLNNCQPSPLTASGCLKDSAGLCLRAYAGLIGTGCGGERMLWHIIKFVFLKITIQISQKCGRQRDLGHLNYGLLISDSGRHLKTRHHDKLYLRGIQIHSNINCQW